MKGRIFTGLMLVGLVASAGAFAQSPYNDSRYSDRNNGTQRYGNTAYDNGRYHYDRAVDSRYDYQRYDKRTQRQMRRMNRERDRYNRTSGIRYNESRYHYNPRATTTRYNDPRYNYEAPANTRYNQPRYDYNGTAANRWYGDNDQYINDIYGDASYRDSRSGNYRYDKKAERRMRRMERKGYGSRYGTGNYHNRYRDNGYSRRDARQDVQREERGIIRNRRSSYDDNRYDYPGYGRGTYQNTRNSSTRPSSGSYDRNYLHTRPVNMDYEGGGRYYDRPLIDRQGSVNYEGMPEGKMDYDTWMRNRSTSRMDNQRRDQMRETQEYLRQEQRRERRQW